MSKHTPGPWIVGKPSVAHGVQIFHLQGAIRQEYGTICTMPAKGKGRTANARLIAAAPDLLEACKCLLADLEGASELMAGHPVCWYESIAEARDAIAKATPPTRAGKRRA